MPHRLLPGVFVGSHAIAEGLLTRKQLRERGYRRLVQGVYADPSLTFDHQLRCRGVALLVPDGSSIGGHSAAAWHGAPFATARDIVTVVTPRGVDWKGPREVRVHRTDLKLDEAQLFDGVPVTAALRTAWDVATLEPVGTAVAALDAMARGGSIDVRDLMQAARDGAGRWGVTRVRRALQLVDPRAESAPESRVRVALSIAGLDPVPQFEVCESGQFLARVDLAFPEAKLAIEYEGAYHFEGVQIVRDDARLAGLISCGWRVIRLRASDLYNMDAVVHQVCQALAL